MSDLRQESKFDIEQDLSFTEWECTVQRVGWGVMGLAVILALLGVFSSGPLSHANVTSTDARLSLQYEQFVRYLAPTVLRVHLRPEANGDRHARLWIDRRYLQGVEVQQVTPQPQRVEAAAERFTYVFALAAGGQPTTVTFHVQLNTTGPLPGRLGLGGGPPLAFSQFVYP
jgi:hypothetical protein